MKTILQIVMASYLIGLMGCATQNTRYFDSTLNDHNVAPASLRPPEIFDFSSPIIDAPHNQANADYLFMVADLESLQGRPNEAIEILKSALLYDPQSAVIMQKIAIELYRKNQIRDSIYWAEKGNATEKRRDLSLLLAGLYSTVKKYDKAIEIYTSLIQKNKQDYDAQLYLGVIYSEQKNYQKAIEQFLFLTKEYAPMTYLAHYYLARTYFDQDEKTNRKKIEIELRRSIAARSDFFEAVSLLGQQIQKTQGNDKAFQFYLDMQKNKGLTAKLAEVLSQYYIEKSEYDKAYEQLEILEASSDEQIQIKLKMALILIDKKILDKAVEKLKEILVLAPESDKVRFYLSAVYEERNDFQLAYQEYIKITKDSSYFEEARAHAAYLSKLLGDPERGLRALNELPENKITNIQTYLLKAQLYEETKSYEKSIEVIQAVQKVFPKNAQAYFYLGALYDKLNKKPEMMGSMEKALELDPDHTQAMNYIAFSLAEMNQHLNRAEKLARLALSKDKIDGFIMDTLGWILYKKGNYKEALFHLERAYHLQPQVSIIAEHLGEVYSKVQNIEKAKALLQKANDLEENHDKKRDLQAKILNLEKIAKNQMRKPASAGADLEKVESP